MSSRLHSTPCQAARILSGLAALALTALAFAANAAAAPELTVRGSVHQVDVVGAAPHQKVALLDRRGRVVQTRRAASLGGIVYRGVKPGPGYRLRRAGGTRSATVAVTPGPTARPRLAPRSMTRSCPPAGYGYMRTRDGTSLAIDVRLPGPASGCPYPTLVEYAGYGYADPAGAEKRHQRRSPTSLGFAVVDVNMRGTGCSGGSFDYFEPLQNLDGYDIIETVARQPWVVGHRRVGMLGHLLRWHQPTVRRRHGPAAPGRDRAAVGRRQHRRHAVSGRHPQYRLHAGLGSATATTTRCRPRRTGGEPWAFQTDSMQGDRDVQGQSGPAAARRSISWRRPAPTTTSCPRWPTRWRPSHSSTRSTSRSISPASSPTSRPEATAPTWRNTSRAQSASGSRSPTASMSTHWTRRRSTAGTTSWSCTWPTAGLACSSPTRPGAVAPTAFSPPARAINGVTLPFRPDPEGSAHLRRRRVGLPGAQADPHHVRQRRRQHDAGRALSGVRAVLLPLPDPRHAGAVLVSVGQTGRSEPIRRLRPRSRPATSSTWKPKGAARPGRPTAATTGSGGLWSATSGLPLEGDQPGRNRRGPT